MKLKNRKDEKMNKVGFLFLLCIAAVTAAEDPVKPSAQDPAKPSTQGPTKPPTQDPAKAPTQNPATAPTQNPATAPTQNPSKPPTQDPTKPSANNPANPSAEDLVTLAKDLVPPANNLPLANIQQLLPLTQDPAKPLTQDPAKAPTQDPAKTSTQDSAKPTTQNPAKPATQSPANPPTQDSATASTQNSSKPPTQDPAKPPTQDPAKAPANDPAKAPAQAPSTPAKPPVTTPGKGTGSASDNSIPCLENVQAANNFNASLFQGLWYEKARLAPKSKRKGTCQAAQFTAGDNGTLSFVNYWREDKRKGETATGTITMAGANASEGKIKVKFDGQTDELLLILLHIDYTKGFNIGYSCFDGKSYVWIFARNKKAKNKDVDVYVNSVTQKYPSLDKKFFKRTSQKKCASLSILKQKLANEFAKVKNSVVNNPLLKNPLVKNSLLKNSLAKSALLKFLL